MGFVLMIHSLVRWLIVVVGVVGLIKLGLGWLQGKKYEKMDNGLVKGFSGLMDLQMLLGLIFLIGDGLGGSGFPAFRIEHAITLFVAVVVAHLPARWKNADDKTRLRNSFLAILASMLLIVAGVATVGGWSR